jgi:3-oxoacyl-[acyl-carrier protein] reductase
MQPGGRAGRHLVGGRHQRRRGGRKRVGAQAALVDRDREGRDARALEDRPVLIEVGRSGRRRAPPAQATGARLPCSTTMTRFEGRVALVTGASGGIGGRIAERLAGEGAIVALHYASNAEPAQQLAAGLPGAAAFGADLGDPDAPERLVDEVEAALGPVEVLVANHGAGGVANVDEVDAAAFDAMVAVNLRAPYLLARRALRGMRERGFGRILFMSSVAGLTGGIIGPHYAASKSGLHGLAHYLASRAAMHGVTVNVLAPALIEDTGMLPGDPSDLAKRIPVGRVGRPEEVADLALAMLRNGYMTSEVVGLDGGIYPR